MSSFLNGLSTTSVTPTTNNGASVGSAALAFSNVYLASGGIINFANGAVTLTQASTTRLEIAGTTGAVLRVPSTGGIEFGSDTALTRVSAGVIAIGGVTAPTVSSADTLTNKRVTPRINSTTSSAAPAINVDTTDQFNITALATNITSMTSGLTGTPTDGQKLLIRIKGTAARTITWGASFTSSGTATLLASTATTKTHMVGLIYDAATATWVCQAVDATGY